MRCESPFMFGIEGEVSENGKQEPRFPRCIRRGWRGARATVTHDPQERLDKVYERLMARMTGLGAEAMSVAGLVNVMGVGHDGKLFLFLQRNRLVLKLPFARAADLQAAGLVQGFQLKSSVPTRGWVVVSGSDWVVWERLADEAHSHAREHSIVQ